jgi:endonuclease/exonuclease/phosphatase family metal-dependent hydrolase
MADPLRVLTYNILNENQGEGAFDRRFGTIAALVLDLKPDVVCLQEAPDTASVRRLVAMMVERQQRAMFVALTKMEQADGWQEYLAIIHPGTRAVATRQTAPSGERVAVSLKLAASNISVTTTHLNPFSSEARHAQAASILASLPDDGPAMLCGDLNAAPTGETLKLLQTKLEVLAPNLAGPPTFATGLRKEPASVILDYILGRGLKAVDAGLVGDRQVNGIWPSDHIGVWADVVPA